MSAETQYSENTPFRMVIEDIFVVKESGVVIVGQVEAGVIHKNDTVFVMGQDKVLQVSISGVDAFFSPDGSQPAIRSIGLLLRGVHREDIEIGMIVTTQSPPRP